MVAPGCYSSADREVGERDAGRPERIDSGWPSLDASPPPADAGAGIDAARPDAEIPDATLDVDAAADPFDGGEWPDAGPPVDAACGARPDAGVTVSPHTVDWIESQRDNSSYWPSRGLELVRPFFVYHLSDGSMWDGGAGTAFTPPQVVRSVERVGTTLRYRFTPTRLLERIDYDSGAHSVNFALDAASDMVLVAEVGGRTGSLRGWARVVVDQVANYRDVRFNHLSAPLCSVVPVVMTMTLSPPATFTEVLFDREFEYDQSAVIDFRVATP